MKHRIVTSLLSCALLSLGFCLALSTPAGAQQPRLPGVKTYIEATGSPITAPPAGRLNRVFLWNPASRSNPRLLLDLPPLDDKGALETIPLGFRLDAGSQVALGPAEGSLCQSEVRPLYNPSVFTGVSYFLCDSTVYALSLFFDPAREDLVGSLDSRLRAFFSHCDVETDSLRAYSDPDYLVALVPGKLTVYSLFHYPALDAQYPGVRQLSWQAPLDWPTSQGGISPVFFNQVTKENNMQSAFKILVNGKPCAAERWQLVRFVTDRESFEYKLTAHNQSRVFLFPEELKALARTHRLRMELEDAQGGVWVYNLPAFQRASISWSYEYFRWNVTNPRVKYRHW